MQVPDKQIPVNNKMLPDQFIKTEPFRKEIRSTAPHKHRQYLEIVLLTAGRGFHWIDDQQYEIRPGVIFFISQDQVHNWDISADPDGYVLILKSSFTDRSLDKELRRLIQRVANMHCLYLDDTSAVTSMMELLRAESSNTSDLAFQMKEGLIKALLSKILLTADIDITGAPFRRELYQAFLELIPQKATKLKVSEYAALLNTTPQNLNAACRKAVNQPAANILDTFIINEARRLLRYTNGHVSEIAIQLNFSDASHFVKFFKRHTGQTPLQFRSI